MHVYHQYTVRVAEDRDGFARALADEHGVGSGRFYPIPIDKLKPFAGSSRELPETERAARECCPSRSTQRWRRETWSASSRRSRSSPEPEPDMGDLRIGLVGVGMMGRNHARVLHAVEGVELVGVADPAGDRHGMAGQATVVGDVSALVRLGLDAAIVAVPHASTSRWKRVGTATIAASSPGTAGPTRRRQPQFHLGGLVVAVAGQVGYSTGSTPSTACSTRTWLRPISRAPTRPIRRSPISAPAGNESRPPRRCAPLRLQRLGGPGGTSTHRRLTLSPGSSREDPANGLSSRDRSRVEAHRARACSSARGRANAYASCATRTVYWW